jgi:hypothetical protein
LRAFGINRQFESHEKRKKPRISRLSYR